MLVEFVRDGAAERLRRGLASDAQEIDRVFIGRQGDGTNRGATSARVRILPLPSIGHSQADMRIRRILAQVPQECPLRSDDVAWAFSGLRIHHPRTNELIDVLPTTDLLQLKHYGLMTRSQEFGEQSHLQRLLKPHGDVSLRNGEKMKRKAVQKGNLNNVRR